MDLTSQEAFCLINELQKQEIRCCEADSLLEIKKEETKAAAFCLINELQKQEIRCREAESFLEIKKEETKAAKAFLELQIVRLRSLTRMEGEEYPLFDNNGEDSSESNEDWRTVELADIDGIANGVIEKLAEVNIYTVGDVSDWHEQEKRLTDVPGIGEKKAETIEDALANFWPKVNAVPPDEGQESDPKLDSVQPEYEYATDRNDETKEAAN